MSREEALDTARTDRAPVRQGRRHADERPCPCVGRLRVDRVARPRPRARDRRPPAGRIVEIFGPESSGKTTLVYHVIAEAQRRGGICAFIDAEHAMDPQYARKIGVNIDDLLVSQPDNGEQALEIAELLIRSGRSPSSPWTPSPR